MQRFDLFWGRQGRWTAPNCNDPSHYSKPGVAINAVRSGEVEIKNIKISWKLAICLTSGAVMLVSDLQNMFYSFPDVRSRFPVS